MKTIVAMLLLTVFFIVEYESYTWNPCHNGNCLTIYCPDGVCRRPAQQFIVSTLEEVRQIVDKNGTEHLIGMYRVEFSGNTKQAQVIPLKLVPSFEIQDKP